MNLAEQVKYLAEKVDALEKKLYTINSELRVALLGQVDTLERGLDMERTSELRRRLKEAKQEIWALKQRNN